MSSQDFLNYSIGFGFLVLTGFVSFAFFNLSTTLKKFNLILERVDNVTRDIEELKNGIKVGLVYLKSMLARKVGDKYDNKQKRNQRR